MTSKSAVSLKRSIESLYERLQKIYDYLKTAKSDNFALIEAKWLRSSEIKQELKTLSLSISDHNIQCNKGEEVELNISSFDDLFDVIYERYYTLSHSYKKKTGSGESSKISQTSSNLYNVSLPPIQLPIFSGNISEWSAFIQLFDSLVHLNNNLSFIQKLQYLRSHLSGEPYSLISSYALEECNYEPSYNSLLNRYSNKRRTLNYYISQILNYSQSHSHNKQYLSEFLSCHVNSIEAILAFDAKTPCLDYILFHLTYLNLSSQDRYEFDCLQDSDKLPSTRDLFEFARKRSQSFELMLDVKPSLQPTQLVPKARIKKSHHTSLVVQDKSHKADKEKYVFKLKCFCCSQNHKIYFCDRFKQLKVADRLELVKRTKRCLNCLGAPNNKCKSLVSCKHCGSRDHHTLLHLEPERSFNQNEISDLSATVTCTIANSNISTVLLGTLVANIKDCFGIYQKVRCLVDSGSDLTCITSNCADRLGFPQQNITRHIIGLSNQGLSSNKQIVFDLCDLTNNQIYLKLSAAVVPRICNYLPTVSYSSQILHRFKNYKLADPEFYKSNKVDILLGADVFTSLLSQQQPVLIPGEPSLLSTKFGFVLSGKVSGDTLAQLPCSSHTSLCITSSLDTTLRKFWEEEHVSTVKLSNPDDDFCESHFSNSVSQASDGKYIVRLPFKSNSTPLAFNRDQALKRFINLEKRLRQHPKVKQAYNDIFKEYLSMGHMIPASSPSPYILPHFAVFKQSSTTSTRVVFDASSRDVTGLSLNDRLYTGPKLQKFLPDIIDQVRFYKYCISCDIVKMYRNIWLHPDDCKVQHIFYRFSSDQIVSEYELRTCSFGLSSAPFLAQRVIIQLVSDYGKDYPLASNALTNQTYIDDVITGCNSESEGYTLISQLQNLLAKGGFSVKKWSSSCHKLLTQFPELVQEKPLFLTDDQQGIKILGIFWNPTHDCFSYQVTPWNSKVTKRNILSYISKLFDCNGWLSPIIFLAKCFIQQLWLAGLEWDEPVKEPLNSQWLKFTSELPLVERIQIPRSLYYADHTYKLFGFSDASERGYGCSIYLNISSHEFSKNYLLRTKSKVAPLKRVTIPRLELCASLLLCKLMRSISVDSLPVVISNIYYFTDSKVVLAWLKCSPHLLSTYVANRITQILEITQPTQWHYIQSCQNPADCISRGLMPSKLLTHDLYWEGPTNIQFEKCEESINVPELKSVSSCFHEVSSERPITQFLKNCSSYSKAIRVVAYILRFIHNKFATGNLKKNWSSFSH